MLEEADKRPRSVVPRWRSLARTPSFETRSNSKQATLGGSDMQGALAEATVGWEKSHTLVSASDMIDAAIVSGRYGDARSAASFVLSGLHRPVAGLVSAAKHVMSDGSADQDAHELNPLETVESTHKAIRSLKHRLSQYPRDAIAALEIARLQVIIGQSRAGIKYINRALAQAPNSRYVLRCASRFFVHIDQPDQALHHLLKSDAVKSDPWVQSAEVAVSDILDRSPRWGLSYVREARFGATRGIAESELSIGLATLEWKNGAKRKFVRQLIDRGLSNPTENALAQAQWVKENSGDDNHKVLSLTSAMESAHEARTLAAYENGNVEAGAHEAWLWLQDQPFSLHAAFMGAHFYMTLGGMHEKALPFLNIGEISHPNNLALVNNKLVAFVYMGRMWEAKALLEKMQTIGVPANRRPFIYAAEGLIKFRSGQIEDGRQFYSKAIEAAIEEKSRSLVYGALMYWLEQEAYAGSMSPDLIRAQICKVNDNISSKEQPEMRAIRKVWDAKRKMIEDLCKYRESLLKNSTPLKRVAKIAFTKDFSIEIPKWLQ